MIQTYVILLRKTITKLPATRYILSKAVTTKCDKARGLNKAPTEILNLINDKHNYGNLYNTIFTSGIILREWLK